MPLPGLVRCCSSIEPVCVPAAAILLEELAVTITLASPKSSTLAWPRLVMKMFAGLMSRWMMPSVCAASSASAISMASDRINSVSSGRPAMRCFSVMPIQKLHGDERLITVLADVVNRADVGVVERRGRLRFAPETFECLRVPGYVVRQELQGNETAELGVLGLVNDAHPAAAELLDDAVVRDGLADHWRQILRDEERQVNERHGVGANPHGWLARHRHSTH